MANLNGGGSMLATVRAASRRHRPSAARERTLGDRLDRALSDVGVGVVLHRCSLPDSTGVIDHLVVTSSGVWIIDATSESARVERRDVGGFLREDVRLFVGDHDCTDRARAMGHQIDVVERVIEPLAIGAVPLHRVLCFTDADWSRFARPFDVAEVLVCWPRKLLSMVGDGGPFDVDTIDLVASHLGRELPVTG